jgi:hypothetical protein
MSIMKKFGKMAAKKVSTAKRMTPGITKGSIGPKKVRVLSPGMRKAIGKKVKGY